MKPNVTMYRPNRILQWGVLIISLAVLAGSCKKDDEPGEVVATTLELNKIETELELGDTDPLSVTSDIGEQTVTWTSSAPTVATVDANGTVVAIGFGTATITASTEDKSATCTVTVFLAALELDESELSLDVGDTEDLTVTSEIGDADVLWETSDATIATVDDGTVTSHKGGEVTISATVAGVTATTDVSVAHDIYVSGVELDSSGN